MCALGQLFSFFTGDRRFCAKISWYVELLIFPSILASDSGPSEQKQPQKFLGCCSILALRQTYLLELRPKSSAFVSSDHTNIFPIWFLGDWRGLIIQMGLHIIFVGKGFHLITTQACMEKEKNSGRQPLPSTINNPHLQIKPSADMLDSPLGDVNDCSFKQQQYDCEYWLNLCPERGQKNSLNSKETIKAVRRASLKPPHTCSHTLCLTLFSLTFSLIHIHTNSGWNGSLLKNYKRADTTQIALTN